MVRKVNSQPNKAELLEKYHLLFAEGKISVKEFFNKCKEILNVEKSNGDNQKEDKEEAS